MKRKEMWLVKNFKNYFELTTFLMLKVSSVSVLIQACVCMYSQINLGNTHTRTYKSLFYKWMVRSEVLRRWVTQSVYTRPT